MKTNVVIFPFDLFGGGGAAAGAQLLADALREMLADNEREQIPTRARAYKDRVKVKEFTFARQADYDDWRGKARAAVRQAWRRGDFLMWITGNHLGALPVYDELAGEDDGILVVQLDAHLDIYNLSDCTRELSHGNFLLHCDGRPPPLVNVGHRELLLRPDYIAEYYQETFPAAALAIDPEPAVAYLTETCPKARGVFLDLDCDVLDPAFFPASGHAVPFGLTSGLLLRLIDAACSGRLIGVSLSEFEPGRDERDRSLETLVWLLEYLLLKVHEKPGARVPPPLTARE